MLIKNTKIPILEIVLMGFLPSFLKRIIYRFKGYEIGKNVSFGFGSVLIGNDVKVGDNSTFGFLSVVRGNIINIKRYVSIGALTIVDTEKIIIGEDSRIKNLVIVGGLKTPESMLKIGKRVIIMEYSFINPTKPIEIGDDSGIGGHCLLFTHGSWLSQLDGFPVKFAPITLGEKVWLPWRVFIMPGVEIGNEVVIGANSLITKSLPSNVLAAGSPAKIIVDNYPKPITNKTRKIFIDNILDDFIDYLIYNGFIAETKIELGSKFFKFKKKNNISEMCLCVNSCEPKFSSIDNIVVVDSELIVNYQSKMVINLANKTRLGSSDVGEEFVKFISRYGIRFDRLD